jgi:uncharacterized phiE125 gp8 family phage protein
MLSPLRLAIDPIASSPTPYDLQVIKEHCAVDFDDQDDLLSAYALAAITAFENATHRTLITRTHRWMLAAFPIYPYERIWLPRGKTVTVEQIDYVQNESTATLTGPSSTPAGDEYQEDLRGDDGAVIMPLQGQTWPSTDTDHPAPVLITFTAGYGTVWDELPADIQNALLFHIRTSLDDQRTDPTKQEANLKVFETLVSGYRLSRFY